MALWYGKTLSDCIKGEEWNIYMIILMVLLNITLMKWKTCFY